LDYRGIPYKGGVYMLKVDKEKCVGDAICTYICPRGAAFIDDTGKAEISPNLCIECYTCMNSCPENAIYEINDGDNNE